MSDQFANDLANRFARGVWKFIPSEDDLAWVETYASLPLTSEPLGDIGELVRTFRSAGIGDYQIARFAKLVCYEAVFSTVCYLEDHEADDCGPLNDLGDEWNFVATARDGRVIGYIWGAHALLLGYDPSDRELRPLRSRGAATTPAP